MRNSITSRYVANEICSNTDQDHTTSLPTPIANRTCTCCMRPSVRPPGKLCESFLITPLASHSISLHMSCIDMESLPPHQQKQLLTKKQGPSIQQT
jgi:hypothetical protein